MAEDFLRNHPGLRPFVLSDVQLTGIGIGGGAYGKVEEVVVPVSAAAKTIYPFLQGEGRTGAAEQPKAATEFVRECQLMSTLRHPNIVQFLGVAFFPGSRLPALVMERLLTSLHDLLDPDAPPPPAAVKPLSFSMVLKCSVLQNVACGLAYLHDRSPPVIHRDLSARNVLLDSEMVAKIADLGVARILPRITASSLTQGPGALVYMPPEAYGPGADAPRYDASIDIFSFGVIALFTLGESFPSNLLGANFLTGGPDNRVLVARTEIQRREEYVQRSKEKLRACGQLTDDTHPLLRLIQRCLHNDPPMRPSICEVLGLLEEARAGVGDEGSERNKRELVRALETQPRNQNLERVVRDLVTENASLVTENAKLQSLMQAQERELTLLRQQLDTQTPHPCKVSGPGLTSATVEHPTHVLVELTTDPSVAAQNVIARLECISKTPFLVPQKAATVTVSMTSPTQCEVSYTPVSRGQHKLSIQLNDTEIHGSPFYITVFPDPRQMTRPVKLLPGLSGPYGIVYDGKDGMIVCEMTDDKLTTIDTKTQALKPFIGSVENSPRGVAFDDAGNVYVTSKHKLRKFTSSGELVASVGGDSAGSMGSEFTDPRGVTIHKGLVYVCDSLNNRIQIFDLNCKFVRSIGSPDRGKGRGEFDEPLDVKFDTAGNMYVAEWGSGRVQVLDRNGEYLREFGEKGRRPSGLHFAGDYIYVSDLAKSCITVYEIDSGKLVSVFGDKQFKKPYCITSSFNGFIYVCDSGNNRVHIY